MNHFRVIRVSLLLLLVCAFPLLASAATTDFRILFDVDHDPATGCTVSTMPGVDHVFTTRVDTTATTAAVSQTFRQVCSGGVLGPQIAVSSTGWPAGFQPDSGQLLVETRIPFDPFPDSTMPRNMRIGLVGSQGASVHTALTRPSGEMVFFPAPSKGRRRAVSAPGPARTIVLDGIGTDWNGLKASFDGIASGGVAGLRIIRFFAFADTNHNFLYFRFDVNTSNTSPLAIDDFYTRPIGSGLTVPGVDGNPTVLENDIDPNGLPLSATLVSQPAGGQVVLDETGGFTYTPDDPASTQDDTFEYRASNGTHDSNVATVTIVPQEVDVSGPNQEPSFTKGADPLVLEDSGPQSIANWATGISAGPGEEDQNVTFVVTNVTNASLFDDPPAISANGTLTFTPGADMFGLSTVTVKIVDDGGVDDGGDNESPTQSFTIAVEEVNDAPTFTAGPGIIVEDNDGAQNLPWATNMSPGPPNEGGQVLHFTLTNDNPGLFSVQPSIATNGTITFTPAPGQTGFANIVVFLHDDGGTANGGVDTSAGAPLIITVEKAPLITSANNTTFTVGQAGSFLVTTQGIPRPSIAITGTLPAGITFVDGTGANKGTGTLSGTPAPGTGGTYPLTFQATNVRGSSPIQNFTLTINQPPAITSANTATFTRNTLGSFTITTTGFPFPALSLTGTLPAGLSFTDNGNGTATINGTPTAVGGSYPGFTVTASNGVGANAQQNLTIVINEIPTITSANNTGFNAGVPATFTVTTTGFPTPTLGATGTLPTGITFTDNGNGTATLGGTAAEGSGGVYTITITATNIVGSTPQTFTITVCNTIAVTNPGVTSATIGAAFSQNFTQTGAVGSATFSTASTLPTGLTLAANGTLSGTPTQLGSFPIVVTVTDANGCTGTGATYTLTIVCQSITVNNPANSNGTAGAAFSETFTQTNAIGGATFTTSSTLPAGLTLAANGVLSGTPTQTGTFPIVVTVTDGNGCTGTGSTYNLVIGCQTITVNNPANTNGTAGTAFSETFTQANAIGGATFTTSSTLPAGLTLAANGVLSGTPTQTGSFPIVVTVTDGNGCTGTGATYTLVIGCQVIGVFNPANANGTAGSAFSETFTQSGAIGSATFTTASTLPAGITLAANGVLSGTPTQTGTFPIVVTVTDANGCTGTGGTYNLVIACQTITVTNPSNSNVTVGDAVFEPFGQTGGIGTVTFTLASGTLPAGLTLTPGGTINGFPTQTGSFPITVTATDSNGCTGTSPTYTLVVACQTITVTNPSNANGTANAAFSETFTESGSVGTATFTTSSTLPTGITLAANGVLSGTPTQTGTFPIVVTVTDSNGCTGTGATYNLVIGCQTITVNNPANANGTANAAFSETFTQTGAIGTATFTTSSTLPAGLTLATNGVLSGTPTQTGSFPITVTVTDSNGCTGTSATYTLVIGCQTITVTNPANANGTAASAFSETFTQTGAIGTATFTLASGTLPAGLTLAANGVLSGTPTQTGSFPITVTVTDSNGCTGTSATYTIVIACQTINVTNPANTNGTVSAAFSETFTQTGAIGTATFTTASTLPAGLTLAANGVLSGTPTQTGSFPIVVTVTDSNGCTGTSATYTLVIGCQTITVTNPANTNGTVSSPFSEQFTQTGAVGTATFTTASTLPAGITLATDGTLSGTPTQNGTFPIVVTVTDSNGCTGTSATYNLVIACQTITVTNPANATGPAGSPFSETFTQTGAIGTATFTTASTLPTGLTLATNGVLSGTPTQGGTFPIVVTVTDSNGCTGTSATYNLVITCPVITVTNPANANGTANSAFSETFTETGAQGGATFTTASTLPAGLTLATNGVLSGTPTQTGTFPIVVTVTDGNGCTGSSSTYNLVIACQTITVTNPANANGVANAAFSETFTQTGAIGTATFTLGSGTLPAGLTLAANGVLSGTPTQTGSFPITVTVTDSNGCTGTSATYTIVIACQTITVTNPSNAAGTILVAFSETFTQTGAIGTATFTTSDPLPNGLTLAANGVLSGTPTVTGSFPITVTVTDSNGCTGTGATYTIVISCQTITVTNPGVTGGTVNAVFSQQFTQTGANGGTTFTLNSGTLPNGLTLAANGTLSGTPLEDGTFPITVLVTDGNGCTGVSATYNLVIACQTITVTNPSNAAGTVSIAFSETFTQTGAVGTATFTTASTLPAGLTLSTAGVLSGTPTEDGTFPIVVTVTDANGCTGTGATYTLVISCQTITVTNPGVTAGTVNTLFSQQFTQTGAVGTATFTTSSTLPAGLTLAADGTLSGTPTEDGSFPIVVTVTDSNGCTGTSSTYTLVIACQVITVNNPVNENGTAGVAFSETFTATNAVGTTTFTTSSTLPNGLTLSTAGVLSGTPTQNGTFPIVVTATDSNGCTGTGATYNLVIACPVITWTPANTLPNATYGAAYSQNISVSGGTGPYTLTLANATTVPTSFTFTDNTNGTATVASANPTVTGVFTFDVNVLDTASGCNTVQTFSLTVIPNVQNDIYSAAGGLTDSVGNTQAVAAGFSTPTTPFVSYTPSVLANDSAPAGTLTVVTPSVTNAAGTVTFNAAGGWSYIPAVGFTGTATFAFVVASNGAQANASMDIVVTNKVWYVRNNAGAGGDGRSHLPFNTLAAAVTASAINDTIFIHNGDNTTTGLNGNFTMKNGQSWIGERVGLTVNGNALVTATPAQAPQLANTTPGNVVTMATGVALRGLDFPAGSGTSITGNTPLGTSVLDTLVVTGGITFANASGTVNATSVTMTGGNALLFNTSTMTATFTNSNINTSGAGSGLAVTGGAPTITFNTTPITHSGGAPISILNTTGGTITFNSNVTATAGTGQRAIALTNLANTGVAFNAPVSATSAVAGSTGAILVNTASGTTSITFANTVVANGTATTPIHITNNTGGTIAFTGASKDVNGDSATGVNIDTNTGATINFTNGGLTIDTTTGTGLNVNGGGTVTISGAGNTVTSTLGTAVNVNNSGANITFATTNSGGGAQNINLVGATGTINLGSGAVSGSTGNAFLVSGGNGTLSYAGNITAATAGSRPVNIQSRTGGSVSLTGTINGSALGILISSNTGGTTTFNTGTVTLNTTTNPAVTLSTNTGSTINFSNGVTITTTSGNGFVASGGGTLTVAGTTNDITTNTGGIAVSITGMIIGNPTGVNFRNVSATGASANSGIVLGTNTTGTIALTGTIQVSNRSVSSIDIDGSGNYTFGATTVSGRTGQGIDIDTSTGTISFTSATINNGGAQNAIDINGSSAGTITFTTLSIPASGAAGLSLTSVNAAVSVNGGSINDSTNADVHINAGNGNFTFAGTITDDLGQLIRITSATGGTKTFSGAITDGFDGDGGVVGEGSIHLSNNASTTMTFSGGVSLSTGANHAFLAQTAGTVNVCATAGCSGAGVVNRLATTTGTALTVNTVNIGANGLTFQSIAANGGANGIFLKDTGASATAGLTVTGTGGAGSGGTIQNTTGADAAAATAGVGIYLENTRHISLDRMQLNGHSNWAIRGSGVVNFTLNNSTINGTNGTGAAFDEGSMHFGQLTGSASITNTNISGGYEFNFFLVNTSGTLDRITFDNVNIGANNTTDGGDALFLQADGTAVIKATVEDSFFTSARGDLFQFSVRSSGANDLIFQRNALSNNHSNIVSGGGGFTITSANTPTLTYNINNNTFRDAVGSALVVGLDGTNGSFSGTIDNNTIGVLGATQAGSDQGHGMALGGFLNGGTHAITITNNEVYDYTNNGIYVVAGEGGTGAGRLNVTITGNTVKEPTGFGGFVFNGIRVLYGTAAGHAFKGCVTLGGAGGLKNDVVGSSGAAGIDEIRLFPRFSTQVGVLGFTPTGSVAADGPAMATFLEANNTVTVGEANGNNSSTNPYLGSCPP